MALPRLSLVLATSLAAVNARRSHDSHKKKHAHAYLQFCCDDSECTPEVRIHKVPAVWPNPALLDMSDVKEAAYPHQPIGTADSNCGASPTNKNRFTPITIPMGLVSPNIDYRHGADVDTFTDWDRIRCKDGQLFATGWYKKYTPQECARLCSKVHDFYGKQCTHFTRQWITTDIEEHSDSCGRDGDSATGDIEVPLGGYASAGVGAGSYKYRGQCIFFSSDNDECCSTKAAWREAGVDTDSSYCQDKYGDRQDAWNSKHRSWRSSQDFTPTSAWPVTSRGRRLEALPQGANAEHPGIHELILLNGSRLWTVEEDLVAEDVTEADAQPGNVATVRGQVQSIWHKAWEALAAVPELAESVHR